MNEDFGDQEDWDMSDHEDYDFPELSDQTKAMLPEVLEITQESAQILSRLVDRVQEAIAMKDADQVTTVIQNLLVASKVIDMIGPIAIMQANQIGLSKWDIDLIVLGATDRT
tara:strand:- start:3 stop:338 length:336 start_codon:yes stop_codon:yes gene_type:complete